MAKRLLILLICAAVIVAGAFLLIDREQNLPVDDNTPQTTLDPVVTDAPDNAESTTLPIDTTEEPTQPTTEPTTEPDKTADEPTTSDTEDTDASSSTTTSDTATQPTVTDPVSIDATVRIMLGGDTSIDGEFADVCYDKGIDYPWKQVSELLNSADLAVLNLETCVSPDGVSEKKEGFGFRTPPEMLEGFVGAGVNVVSLANNHTRDFGYQALLNTFDSLDAYGIDYFGAGNNLDEASGLLIKEVNGIKIGFTGSNRVWLPDDYAAGVDHAGINQIHSVHSPETQAYLKKLKEYDKQVDVLIAFMHYGVEEVFEVSSYQERIAREMIDCGVDIFVGGHSHTLQPIEFYNGKPIFYSIGNFIFWHVDDDIDGLTAVFDMEVSREGMVNLRLHPVFIKRYRANLVAKGSDRYDQILALMNDLCNPNGIAFDEDGYMIEYVPPLPEETETVTEVTQANIPADE